METDAKILAAREALKAKMGGKSKIGGNLRRKHKAQHTSVAIESKKLEGQMKRLGCNTIPGIEEVNMFTDSGEVIHMGGGPRIQASLPANTFVLTGNTEKKQLTDMLTSNPGIISQMGPDNMASLKAAAAKEAEKAAKSGKEDAKDDDIPDADANFEEVSKVD